MAAASAQRTEDQRKWTRWKRRLPGVVNAILPECSGRSNPVLAGRTLYVSTFAPGVVWALDATNGHVRWSTPIGNLGGSSVLVLPRTVLAKTAQRLFCLSRATGATRWSFAPYGDEREMLYANPIVVKGVVFMGDRLGLMHALDVATGRQLWKVDAGHGAQINSTACDDARVLYFGTNGAEAIALRASDGQIVWRTKLDGPCTWRPQRVGADVVVRTMLSLFRLRRRDGHVREAWSPGGDIKASVAIGDCLFVVDEVGDEPRLFVHRRGRTQSQQAYPSFGGYEMLHYSPRTSLIYDCRLTGLGILDAATGQRLFEFTGFNDPVTRVDASRSSIFALDMHGVVRALRHPNERPHGAQTRTHRSELVPTPR